VVVLVNDRSGRSIGPTSAARAACVTIAGRLACKVRIGFISHNAIYGIRNDATGKVLPASTQLRNTYRVVNL
jgi:hypothetical protein